MLNLSVVIPTRNRKENLLRTLNSLNEQSYPLLEVLVVDSSDKAEQEEELKRCSGISNLQVIRSEPSVCLQRNTGIKVCRGDCVFLLDDDISLDKNYINTLMLHLEKNRDTQITTGLVMEKDGQGEWNYKQAPPHPLKLLWIFVFQLGIWSQLSEQKAKWPWKILSRFLQNYYSEKRNGISKSGWPLITTFTSPVFETRIYGLGASIIRRDWLIEHLYDENLDQHGIGDNYGIAICLSEDHGISVHTNTKAFHHKSPVNRLNLSKAYYFRILALDYFSRLHRSASRNWLCWSLLGNALSSLLGGHWDLFKINLTLIWRIGTNQNPLVNKKITSSRVE